MNLLGILQLAPPFTLGETSAPTSGYLVGVLRLSAVLSGRLTTHTPLTAGGVTTGTALTGTLLLPPDEDET